MSNETVTNVGQNDDNHRTKWQQTLDKMEQNGQQLQWTTITL
jgi:hypothetical protein